MVQLESFMHVTGSGANDAAGDSRAEPRFTIVSLLMIGLGLAAVVLTSVYFLYVSIDLLLRMQ
jgi:hypothetical protein